MFFLLFSRSSFVNITIFDEKTVRFFHGGSHVIHLVRRHTLYYAFTILIDPFTGYWD